MTLILFYVLTNNKSIDIKNKQIYNIYMSIEKKNRKVLRAKIDKELYEQFLNLREKYKKALGISLKLEDLIAVGLHREFNIEKENESLTNLILVKSRLNKKQINYDKFLHIRDYLFKNQYLIDEQMIVKAGLPLAIEEFKKFINQF